MRTNKIANANVFFLKDRIFCCCSVFIMRIKTVQKSNLFMIIKLHTKDKRNTKILPKKRANILNIKYNLAYSEENDSRRSYESQSLNIWTVGTAQLEKWIRAGDLRKEEKEQ